jgi:Cof subfamily protein (haloacid dehalogenase superfamily)
MPAHRFRILALDVDGTLLDPDGSLRPRTKAAVARAARAGIRPVLCTGRRYRRAWPIAEQLELDAPLVCNSGAIIKDPGSHGTIWRADFDGALSADVLDLFHLHDQPAVIFTDRGPLDPDFIIRQYPTGRDGFDDYIDKNRAHAEIDAQWRPAVTRRPGHTGPAHGRDSIFHICAIGTTGQMLEFQAAAHNRVAGRIQTFVQRFSSYRGTMCEILRHDAGKWAAILHLAQLWRIEPASICAVGDDSNDILMIKNAGLGVAMGHARSEILAAADLVTGSHDEDGVAMLVEDVLLA